MVRRRRPAQRKKRCATRSAVVMAQCSPSKRSDVEALQICSTMSCSVLRTCGSQPSPLVDDAQCSGHEGERGTGAWLSVTFERDFAACVGDRTLRCPHLARKAFLCCARQI